jgi:DNA-binding transcriptional ArsR family regulator
MDTKKIERISKALGDQTRLRIYEVIAAQENLTCGELVTLQGVTPATISHHLKILMDAELIESAIRQGSVCTAGQFRRRLRSIRNRWRDFQGSTGRPHAARKNDVNFGDPVRCNWVPPRGRR